MNFTLNTFFKLSFGFFVLSLIMFAVDFLFTVNFGGGENGNPFFLNISLIFSVFWFFLIIALLFVKLLRKVKK